MANNMLNNVSIRLMSGGHAFSNSDIDCIKRAGKDVTIEFVTPKTVLRPERGFNKTEAQHELEAMGYVVAEDEVTVCSPAVEGIVAIMAVSANCIEAINVLEIEPQYTSPLLPTESLTEGSYIALYEDVLYVRVYNGGLRFAEAMTVESDADILFYLESINRVYGIYNMYARATGDTKRLNRVCRKCFNNKF